jgi:hypothetical protein
MTPNNKKKLRLDRQTLRRLTDHQLGAVQGGRRNDDDTVGKPCSFSCDTCTCFSYCGTICA